MSYRDGDDATRLMSLPKAPNPIPDPVKVEFSYVCSLAWNGHRGQAAQGSVRDLYSAHQWETVHEVEGQVIADSIKSLGIAAGTPVTVLFLSVTPNRVVNEIF